MLSGLFVEKQVNIDSIAFFSQHRSYLDLSHTIIMIVRMREMICLTSWLILMTGKLQCKVFEEF